jgi:endonuclease YncB( thermonuclease family)
LAMVPPLPTARTIVLLGCLLSASTAHAEASAMVYINGKLSPVYFNDGDSFRVLDGPYRDVKARLAGFNTLESHGPVHQWGGWTATELYVIAKMATANGRRGVWHCNTDGKADGYGRMLLWCPDLADSQVRGGFAHVMSIGDEPGDPVLLRAQREAMEARRGIWAHGIPPFILTSLHSAEEDVEARGNYNRLVSTADGHSLRWVHMEEYPECSRICHRQFPSDPQTEARVLGLLRADPAAAAAVRQATEEDLKTAVHMFARYRVLSKPVPRMLRDPLRVAFERYAKQGAFGKTAGEDTSCMYHVRFQRRYGQAKAACLIK